MRRGKENKAAKEQKRMQEHPVPKTVDMRSNPLYPELTESNVSGVLIAIAAIIIAVVALVLIVSNFSLAARQSRAYQSQITGAQEPEYPTDDQVVYDDFQTDDNEPSELQPGENQEEDSVFNMTDEEAEDPFEEEEDLAISRAGIHTYEVYSSDCTWSEAYMEAEMLGGHLATIDSREEWDYIINQLKGQNSGAYYFYIGGSRQTDASEYFWIDYETGEFYGTAVNGSDFWGSDIWLEGEPTFQDGDVPETKLAILYMKSADRWVLNDVADDTLYTEQYLAGKVAYIVEYE